MIKRVAMALALATGVTTGVAQAEVDASTIEAIKALLGNQHKALDAHDLDGVMATFADSDDIMFMGTGPGEHWIGKEEVKDAYRHFMQGFDTQTMKAQCGEGHASTQGDVLWLTAVCSFNDNKQEQAREFVSNLSAVLVKQGDDWRFHTMHFSHLTDDDSEQQSAAE